MIVTSLELADFRNYTRFAVSPGPSLTVLVGPNATGKTTVIEALRLLTTGASFRRPRWEDLVRWGAGPAQARMEARAGERALDVAVTIDGAGTRSWVVNGRERTRPSDVAGRLPSVVFTPDDLDLVKGPAERRRAAVDELGAQLSAAYGSLRREYGRVVRQRNTLLKDGAPAQLLDPWDDQLALLGSRVLSHRLRLLHRVMDGASERYRELASGERLGWEYEDRCGLAAAALSPTRALDETAAAEAIRAELGRRAAEERRRATTLAGPHRDDVVFTIEGRDARAFGSQGQQRTIALSWKMAEVDTIEDVLRVRPLVLLDDVMSELDADRRAALSAALLARSQAVVTATTTAYFGDELLGAATVVELSR